MNHLLIRPTATALLCAALLVACGTPGGTPPTVTSLSVNTVMPGSTVTLTGTNLGTNGAVTLGGMSTTVTSYSSNSVTFKVPENASWGFNEVQLATSGKTITVPMKLFIGQGIGVTASTTADIQGTLDGLPEGAALLLQGREYTSTNGSPLHLNNRSLYGQGQDKTKVNGDVFLQASGTGVVTVDSMTFSGTNYYLVNRQENTKTNVTSLSTQLAQERQSRLERRRTPAASRAAPTGIQALATESADISASREPANRVRPQSQAADIMAHRTRPQRASNLGALNTKASSGFVLNNVTIREKNAGRGYLENNAPLSFVTVTDSTIELNDYISLGDSGGDMLVKNSVLTSQGGPASGVDIEANGGAITVMGSTITSSMWLNVYSETGNVNVQNSTLLSRAANSVTCQTTPACYSLTDVGSNTGKVSVTGSRVNAIDGDAADAKPTQAFVFIGSIKNLTTIENNALLHSTAHLQLYSDSSKDTSTGSSRGSDQLIVRNNQEISAGDVALGVPGYLGLYSHGGDVTVSGTTRLSSNNGLQVYTKYGSVNMKDNPDVRVDSRQDANRGADVGFLHVYTNGNSSGANNDVTFTGNIVNVDDQVIIDAHNGNLTVSANAMNVAGNSNPKLQLHCREALRCMLTDNQLTASASSSQTTSRIDVFFNHYSGKAAKQIHTVTGNNFQTLGSDSSYFYGAFGWGSASLGNNTFRSSGKVYIDAYQATVNANGNTFKVFDGVTGPAGSGLNLAAYKGTESNPSVIDFDGNTVANVGSKGVTKHNSDGGRNDRVKTGTNSVL